MQFLAGSMASADGDAGLGGRGSEHSLAMCPASPQRRQTGPTVQAARAVARLRAEKAQPLEVVVGTGDALRARRPRRHLLSCPPAALAGDVRGLLPWSINLLVHRVVGVIERAEGGAVVLNDQGSYLSSS
jgi:hypothetical protein